MESPEHGLSPLQLWHRGMLSASPRWQQELADGFCVPPDYRIEESEYFVNNFHHPSVVVPRTDINLTSDHGGVAIYVDVKHHIFCLSHS